MQREYASDPCDHKQSIAARGRWVAAINHAMDSQLNRWSHLIDQRITYVVPAMIPFREKVLKVANLLDALLSSFGAQGTGSGGAIVQRVNPIGGSSRIVIPCCSATVPRSHRQ
jgi:hypothetical protein